MSSILKALEKVEESQSASRTGTAAGFKKPRERKRPWIVPVSVMGGAVVAALGTFAVMGGFSRSAAPVQPAQSVQTAAPAQPVQAVQAVQASQPVQPVQPGQVSPAEPAQAVAVPNPKAAKPAAVAAKPAALTAKAAAKVAANPAVAAQAAPRAAAAKPVAKVAAKPAAKAAEHPGAKPAAKPAPATSRVVQTLRPPAARPAQVRAAQPGKAALQAATAPFQAAPLIEPVAQATHDKRATHEKPRAELRVTGIAWQNDSISSAAIVNGRSLQQGGTVEGYKVEKILEDKVIFSGSSGRLEVPLGAGEQ